MSTSNSSEPTIESWIETSFSEAGQAAVDLLPEEAPFYRRYGNYTLRRNDWDGSWPSAPVEEGREIGLANGDVVLPGIVVDPAEEQPPTVSLGGYVTQLQLDLWNLGFGLIREFDGVFGPRTEQAVREFQIYAGMGRVAQENPDAEGEYVERLSETDNPVGALTYYDGPISGVANEQTRRCLVHWLLEGYRCPVVITARTGDGYESVYDGGAIAEGADAENLWRHDDLQSTAPRVFAVDFTGYYDVPKQADSSDIARNGIRHMVLGEYAETRSEDYQGPISWAPRQTWELGKITPERLISGQPEYTLTGSQRATYSVVHAVSEIECMGYFDSVNAYDRALISIGPCHWTLSLVDQNKAGEGIGDACAGELCAYLAYLQHSEPEAFEEAFGRFGIDLNHEWGNWDSTGSYTPPNYSDYSVELYNEQTRTYASWLQVQKWIPVLDREMLTSMPKEPPNAKSEALYFKSWHWFYRFVMAGRTIEPYRQRMWDMARVRLRDVRTAPIPLDRAPEGADWSAEEVTIGDIFTSEKAAAMVHCWHVYMPADIFAGTQTSCLENAFNRALSGDHEVFGIEVDGERIERQLDVEGSQLDWTGAPSTWTNDHEIALIGALIAASEGEIRRRIGVLFRDENVNLAEDRDSFDLADDDLPNAPEDDI